MTVVVSAVITDSFEGKVATESKEDARFEVLRELVAKFPKARLDAVDISPLEAGGFRVGIQFNVRLKAVRETLALAQAAIAQYVLAEFSPAAQVGDYDQDENVTGIVL